ncbi:glycosyl transferase, partial [Bacteroides intestinalis]
DQGKEYLFITAWNEWGEGAFIEPDEINKMSYLDAIKEVVHEINK